MEHQEVQYFDFYYKRLLVTSCGRVTKPLVSRLCTLFVDNNMTPVYTFYEDVVLSLGNEENKFGKHFLVPSDQQTGTLEHAVEVC